MEDKIQSGHRVIWINEVEIKYMLFKNSVSMYSGCEELHVTIGHIRSHFYFLPHSLQLELPLQVSARVHFS